MDTMSIFDYYADIVMCIDATSRMRPIIEEVKSNALSFCERFAEAMEEYGNRVLQLRVKVIAFRDYGCDAEPMTESRFFLLPDEEEALHAFVRGIRAEGGGNGAANALEAIALALRSDWTTGGYKRRHCIFVFSDSPALPLGARADSAQYPSGMPKDLEELGRWRHGEEPGFHGSYQPRYGRLVAFVPNTEPWTSMQDWFCCWTVFSKAGTDSGDMDIQVSLDMMVGNWRLYPYNGS